MALLRSLPADATLADLRAQFADLLDHLRPYAQRLMRGPSPLTPGERELIAAFVSGINSCHYCYGSHSRVAQAFGVERDTFAALLDDIDIARIDPRLKPILHYVRKLTEMPSRLTEADAAAVYDAGWNDEALLHAIAVCAYFNNMNRLAEGAGTIGNAEEYSAAAENLVAHGYLRDSSTRRTKAGANRKRKRAPPAQRASRRRYGALKQSTQR